MTSQENHPNHQSESSTLPNTSKKKSKEKLPLGRYRGAIDLDGVINKDLSEFDEPIDNINENECDELLLGSKKRRKKVQKSQIVLTKKPNLGQSLSSGTLLNENNQATSKNRYSRSLSELIILDDDDNNDNYSIESSSSEENISDFHRIPQRVRKDQRQQRNISSTSKTQTTAIDLTSDSKILESFHALRLVVKTSGISNIFSLVLLIGLI
jgi:hypothetical protein